jgi:hypothetical protein
MFFSVSIVALAVCEWQFTNSTFLCVCNTLPKLFSGILMSVNSGSESASPTISLASALRMDSPTLPSHFSLDITTMISEFRPVEFGRIPVFVLHDTNIAKTATVANNFLINMGLRLKAEKF